MDAVVQRLYVCVVPCVAWEERGLSPLTYVSVTAHGIRAWLSPVLGCCYLVECHMMCAPKSASKTNIPSLASALKAATKRGLKRAARKCKADSAHGSCTRAHILRTVSREHSGPRDQVSATVFPRPPPPVRPNCNSRTHGVPVQNWSACHRGHRKAQEAREDGPTKTSGQLKLSRWLARRQRPVLLGNAATSRRRRACPPHASSLRERGVTSRAAAGSEAGAERDLGGGALTCGGVHDLGDVASMAGQSTCGKRRCCVGERFWKLDPTWRCSDVLGVCDQWLVAYRFAVAAACCGAVSFRVAAAHTVAVPLVVSKSSGIALRRKVDPTLSLARDFKLVA
jgi:hypothetical protein